MNLLPAFFFAIIGGAMYRSLGQNSDSSGPYTLIFYAVIAVMMLRHKLAPAREKFWHAALATIAAASVVELVRNPVIIYADLRSKWLGPFETLLWGALAFSVVAALSIVVEGRRGSPASSENDLRVERVFRWSASLALLLLFAAQIFVPLISPRPWIDVFVNNTRAVDHFLRGANPYTQFYPDIYWGRYDYRPGFLYFPGVLYWLAPFRALFGDTRYGYVFANLVIAVGLGGLARKLKAPEPMRWLAPLLWLSFPVTFFVLEQSWIDTLLVALAVLVFWALEEEKWILTGVLMGAAFSIKQYGFLVGAVACLAIWRRAGLKTAAKAAGAGAFIAAAVILPFALADWRHFYASTITAQTSSAVRLDAYNAVSFLARDLHWLLPKAARLALSVAGIVGALFYVAKKRPPALADSATALFLGYGTAFLFGKFAFCNYHYLLAGFLLLYLVGFSSETRRTSATSTAPSATAGT